MLSKNLIGAALAALVGCFACSAQVNVITAPAQPPPAKSTLHARVFYEDTGRPVKRTSVMLLSEDGSGGPGETAGVTDADGILEIKNIKTGRYFAFVNAPGVITPFAYLDPRQTQGLGIPKAIFANFPVIAIDGLTNVTVDIPARKGGAISGRIIYSNGDPAIGVRVEALRKVGNDYIQPMSLSTMMSAMIGMGGVFSTDDRGVFRFSGLPPGEYLVKVTENVQHGKERERSRMPDSALFGADSFVTLFFENAFEKADARVLGIQLGQELSNIDIVIPDQSLHSIGGKVLSAKDRLPIRNAKLSIRREGNVGLNLLSGAMRRDDQSTYTDNKGAWSFVQLPKGKYTITVAEDEAVLDQKAMAYGIDPEEMDSGVANANRAMVRAMNTAARLGNMAGNAYGHGYVPPPPPPKFAAVAKEFVVDDEDVADQTIEMTFGATLLGTVTIDGRSDPGPVAISAKVGSEGTSTSVYFYDYSGESATALKSKDFRLDGVPAGHVAFTISCRNQDLYVKSAMSGQIDLLSGTADIRSGDTLANIRVVLSDQTGTLTGSVIDEDKQPVPGFELMLVPTDQNRAKSATYFRRITTDSSGQFTIKLPPFDYSIVYGNPDTSLDDLKWVTEAIKDAERVSIDAGMTSKVTIHRK
jgi:hypothetical protein